MSEHDFARMRKAMVESQLRTSDVNDPAIIAAMASVPRERFAAESLVDVAYMDRSLPLNADRALSPPLALGRLLVEAKPEANDKVLIVGAATGYSAAVLAPLVESVTALESDDALVATARDRLAKLANITVHQGALTEGAPSGAPYDLILIDGAVEQVPDALLAQLADGGRLVTGLADGAVTRLAIGRKAGDSFGLNAFADCEIPALPAFAKERSFHF